MNTIVVGAGGHSRVVYDILRHDQNVDVVAFVDNTPRGTEETIMGIPVLGDHDVIPEVVKQQDVGGFIIAVGDNEIRQRHFEALLDRGLEPVSAIHPESVISETATVGAGTVIAAGVNVSTNVEIGENTILNTGSIVDHETVIGPHVHIAPGTTVAGRVTVGSNTFIGMGSTVRDYVEIGKEVTAGAGSVILDDIPAGKTVAGAPAEIKHDEESD
ncbi:acetyltransferase [Halovenus sp. HT40]|uniref:acetyltransferase n=1 Tax=Halovenus sp. HT40 TaxID=3126691 RepID=UPI00300F4374